MRIVIIYKREKERDREREIEREREREIKRDVMLNNAHFINFTMSATLPLKSPFPQVHG